MSHTPPPHHHGPAGKRADGLLGLPEALLLKVYGHLGYKDKLALSHTCTQMQTLAENGRVFADQQHKVGSSPGSVLLALAHRARNIAFTSREGFAGFLQGYTMLFAPPRWPVTKVVFEEGHGKGMMRKSAAQTPSSGSSSQLWRASASRRTA